MRARTNDEAWVVNHTSDSVSIVSLSQGVVTDTIYAKDEPCDVVFAGSPVRAYVSVSRTNAIKVFDVTTHALVATIPVFGEGPRSLAVSADGSKIYAAFALSGNRTTIIPTASAPRSRRPPIPIFRRRRRWGSSWMPPIRRGARSSTTRCPTTTWWRSRRAPIP